MEKKYYFLVRRSPDIDHAAPISYALLKKGVSSSNIILTDLSYNNSNVYLNENEFFQLIKKKNVKINFAIRNVYI